MKEEPTSPLTWVPVGLMAAAFVGLIVYFFVVNETTSKNSAYVDYSAKEVTAYEKRLAKEKASASEVSD